MRKKSYQQSLKMILKRLKKNDHCVIRIFINFIQKGNTGSCAWPNIWSNGLLVSNSNKYNVFEVETVLRELLQIFNKVLILRNFHRKITSKNAHSSYFPIYLKQARMLQNSTREAVLAARRARMKFSKKARAREQEQKY